MRVTLLGTGSAIPTLERAQSGVLIETSKNLILLDCGSGVLKRIAQSRYSHTQISHVFFTHHHLDHDSDFLGLIKANWLKGKQDLKIYGPTGTKDWLYNLLDAYPYLKGRFDLDITELQDGSKITINDDIVESREMKHGILTLGYKITSQGGSIIYSGDTEPCEGILKLCKEKVNLLIHECSFLDPPNAKPISDHSTPTQLGKFLRGMPIEKLILSHFYPETVGQELKMVEIIARYFDREIVIGRDMLEIEV